MISQPSFRPAALVLATPVFGQTSTPSHEAIGLSPFEVRTDRDKISTPTTLRPQRGDFTNPARETGA